MAGKIGFDIAWRYLLPIVTGILSRRRRLRTSRVPREVTQDRELQRELRKFKGNHPFVKQGPKRSLGAEGGRLRKFFNILGSELGSSAGDYARNRVKDYLKKIGRNTGKIFKKRRTEKTPGRRVRRDPVEEKEDDMARKRKRPTKRPRQRVSHHTRHGYMTGRIIKPRKYWHKRRKVMRPKMQRYIRAMINNPRKLNSYRDHDSGTVISAANSQDFREFWLLSQDTVLSLLSAAEYVYDNAGTIAVDTVDQIVDTIETRSVFKKAVRKFLFRNNSSHPCEVDLYWCKVIDSTDSSILTLWANGVSDKGFSSNEHDLRVGLWDGCCKRGWKPYYRVYKHEHHYMNPGDEVRPELRRGKILVHGDDTTETYQKKQTLVLVVRLQGCLCHDQTDATTHVGFTAAQLDYYVNDSYQFGVFTDSTFRYNRITEGTGVLDTITTPALWQMGAEEETHEI